MNVKYTNRRLLGSLAATAAVLLVSAASLLITSQPRPQYAFLMGKEPIETAHEGGNWGDAAKHIVHHYSFSADPNTLLPLAREELAHRGFKSTHQGNDLYLQMSTVSKNRRSRTFIQIHGNYEPVVDPLWRNHPSLKPREHWVYIKVYDRRERARWLVKSERLIK